MRSEDGRWIGETLRGRARHGMPLLRAWASREIAVRYRQGALGFAWVIGQSALSLLVIGVVVNRVFGIDGAGLPYVSFAYAGLVIWTFAASTLSLGTVALQNAMPIASKTYFPREIAPLAVIAANALDLMVGSAVLIVVAFVQGLGPFMTLIALPIALALAWISMAGFVIILSALTVFIRDMRHVVPMLVQLGFFATPVMYPTTLLPSSLEWLDEVHPLAVSIEALRDVALRGNWPNWPLVIAHLGCGAASLILAIRYTQSVEPRLVDLA